MKFKFFFCLFLVAFTLPGCKLFKNIFGQRYDTSGFPEFDRQSEVVFIVKKNVTVDSVRRFLLERGVITPLKQTLNFCPSCDSLIFSIPGYTYEKLRGQTEKSGGAATPSPGGGPSGPWGPVTFSVNIRFRNPERVLGRADSTFIIGTIATDSSYFQSISTRPLTTDKPALKVGILDTGVEPALANLFPPKNLNSCMTGGTKGWNFVKNNDKFNDDFKGSSEKILLHGSPAAGFMVAQTPLTVPVEIVPIKFLDERGESDLFHVLCGLAYAKKAGVKLLNASFGFYASNREQVQLLEEYIKQLTDTGMIIVCAAGNADDVADKKAKRRFPFDPRNLDQHPFYPAAFSETNQNVISVTTVSKKDASGTNADIMCPTQNFSQTKVQIGVRADKVVLAGEQFGYYFKVPGSKDAYRNGSSFAAPIVTGLIAANYKALFPNGAQSQIDRAGMLKYLAGKENLSVSSALKDKIFGGYVADNKPVKPVNTAPQ